MDKYHKIETLFVFDTVTRKFQHGVFYNKSVELLKNNLWLFTEKVDGTNFRLGWDGLNIGFGGRKDTSTFSKKQEDWIINNLVTLDMETILEQKFKSNEVTIFGELHGHDIQKVGKLYSPDYKFRVFDIKLGISEKPIERKYVSREIVENISKDLGFETVPVVFKGTIDEAIEYVRTHEKSTFSDAPLEGLVGVPVGNFLDQNGERIIVKIKKRDLGE